MDKNPFPFFMTLLKDIKYLLVIKIRISNQFGTDKGYQKG